MITNLVDFGMNVQEAIEAPRWVHKGDQVAVEGSVSEDAVAGLEAR